MPKIVAGFDVGAPVPVDNRMTRKTTAERDNIPIGVRFEGMEVYVEATKTKYRLEGGVTNDCWVDKETDINKKKHDHSNKEELDKIAEGDVEKWNKSEQNAKTYADTKAAEAKSEAVSEAESYADTKFEEIKEAIPVKEVLASEEQSVAGECSLISQKTIVKADGTISTVSWANPVYSYKYDVAGYDAVTVRLYSSSTYGVNFFDAEDKFISSHIDGLGTSSAWINLENIPIPKNASYIYFTMTSGYSTGPTVTLIKNAVYEKQLSIPKDSLDEEVRNEMEQHTTKDFVNKKVVRLPQFMNWKTPLDYGAASMITAEGRYVYLSKHGYLYKIDVSCEVAPVVVESIQFAKYIVAASDTITADNPSGNKSYETTGMAINGDYLYVGNRLSKAGRATEVQTNEKSAGSLFIFSKNTLNPINPTTGEEIDKSDTTVDGTSLYIPFGSKISDLIIHDNNLIVNQQMVRWDIYDVSNPTVPVLLTEETIENFSTEASIEIQKGEVFELGGKVYYAAAGFADGIWLFDITNPSSPTQVWKYVFKGNETWAAKAHTFAVTVKYPYIYATLAVTKSYIANYPIQGILTLKMDEEDISVVPTESKLSLIPVEDMNEIKTGSDSMPSHIVRMGNTLVVNHDHKGIALFDITHTPEQPEYEGVYTPSDNCLIYRLKATPDGRLFLFDKGAGNRLYLVRGLSNINS
ncbi:MAG: hypothetical protein IKU60_03745 [Clostridia bacterium]|nr:hypothetical protein [Clostridia bacterium]